MSFQVTQAGSNPVQGTTYMKYYFGLSHPYQYDFLGITDTVELALKRKFGYSVKFLCNALGGIYDGDVYFIDQNISEEEFCFLKITHGFDQVDTSTAENYIAGKHR